jgi:hypothetical protein
MPGRENDGSGGVVKKTLHRVAASATALVGVLLAGGAWVRVK